MIAQTHTMSASREHWQSVYREKSAAQTSWFRAHLDASLRLIDGLRLDLGAALIDVGAGRSTLVDDLLARGFNDLTLLDIAEPALAESRTRLGDDAARVRWVVADVLDAPLPDSHFDVWHDRAVFHFLTEPAQRARYLRQLLRALRPGGHAVVATFAEDGPQRCSALPVCRYDIASLAAQFAPHFERCNGTRDEHRTPWGAVQPFTYVLLRRKAA